MKGFQDQFLGVLVLLLLMVSVHSALVEKQKQVVKEKVKVFNHGSFRGPRKHLINPTADQFPFQLAKLPLLIQVFVLWMKGFLRVISSQVQSASCNPLVGRPWNAYSFELTA
ncbi:hypothetical protein QYF36_025186 [Acer negundo]|nr:hypothetical protein QYF36_025186 [Acer negundo]